MDGDRPSLSLRRSCFYSCSHHATCLVNIDQTLLDDVRNQHTFSLSFFLSYFRFRLSNKHHHRPLHYPQPASPLLFVDCGFYFPSSYHSSPVVSIIRVYYFQPSPSERPKYGVYRILLSSSFLISHYHLLFSGLHTPIRHIHPVQWGSSQRFTYTNPPIHLVISVFDPVFDNFFHHPFGESIKKEAHALHLVLQLPSVSFLHLDYYLFSLIIQPESFFAPNKHTWAIVRSMPLIFMFRSPSFSRCTLCGIYSPPSRH
jgi:hypothetical protein